jgi:hypothetical protein
LETNQLENENLKSKKSGYSQEKLELAILIYQDKLSKGNKIDIDRAYKNICKIYSPLAHVQEWYNQYNYLFDSYEDFAQDYVRIFCNVLSNWKPRNQRRKSRYDGSGEFKNYFIGALQHNYINLVKADNAGKRNPSQKCPICEKWVNPLSTHLLNHHRHLLWNHLDEIKIDLNKITHCPFCKSHKMPRTFECFPECTNKIENGCVDCADRTRIEALRKHFVSKHSTMLFQKFNELYPYYQTISPRALSVYMADENEGDDSCYYDQIEDKNKINNLLEIAMSDVEHLILSQALSGHSSVKFDEKLYKCTIDEFNTAMDKIKEKMSMVGLEG